jgi:hypothetical protein
MMEGTGLTSSDPAFFDSAALADRATSGNQIGRTIGANDHNLYPGTSRRVEDVRAVCIVSFSQFAVQ